MTKPAVWKNDPECGHDVNFSYQTHYCSYIRVPRLLSLQTPLFNDELFLITAYQWYELWFKVLLTDLRAAFDSDCKGFEPIKLLNRGIELYKLFGQHADMAERIIIRELKLTKCLGDHDLYSASAQYRELKGLAAILARQSSSASPEVAEATDEYITWFKSFHLRFEGFVRDTLRLSTSGIAYAEWLHIAELLDLQEAVKSDWVESGQEPRNFWRPDLVAPDEVMFVIVHQAFEIWFKVILDLIDRAIRLLFQAQVTEATRLIKRVVLIQRLLLPQIQIPTTMLPMDFYRFRNQTLEQDGHTLTTGLSPASGTESYQFREIEIACGLGSDEVFRNFLRGTDRLPIRLLTPRQTRRLSEPTLVDAFRAALEARGVSRLEDIFKPSEVENPYRDLEQLADTLLEFDNFFCLWRLNHISMVERMIGGKSGTGFLGPEYLMETAGIKIQDENRVLDERQVRPRFFEELWEVRTRLGTG